MFAAKMPNTALATLHADTPANDKLQWPTNGEIVFDGVLMRYRPGANLALNGVNFKIKPGEKVGVVGRTGSGKSTLLLALYRMFDLAGGRVIIDGVDIMDLDLRRLRLGLSIIPQVRVGGVGSSSVE
jgi:ATP-binding cassette, subfamily C (CFTR/MRP), member 1